MSVEEVKSKEEDSQLLTQLKYDIFYKRRDLEFAMAKNFSRLKNLETRLSLCGGAFKFQLAIFIFLVIIGAVFLFLIRIGNSLVTMAMGLIYLLNAIIYFIVLFSLFFKIIEQFMRWLENSDTSMGNAYCEKRGIFTMHMEQMECARQITRYQNYIKRLEEIEEQLKDEAISNSLLEWSGQVKRMKIEPEVPNGKTHNTREENILYGFILAGFILIFALAIFL